MQRGNSRRQYREARPRLYNPRRYRAWRIVDNADRKDTGYTKPERTKGGAATIQRGKSNAIQTKKVQRGRESATIRREKTKATQTKNVQYRGGIGDNTEKTELYKPVRCGRGRVGDNTERKGESYTKKEGTEGGGPATMQRDKTKAIQTKTLQRAEDGRQCREERQMLSRPRRYRGCRIGDYIERKDKGYINQECTEKEGSTTIQRKGKGYTDKDGTEG